MDGGDLPTYLDAGWSRMHYGMHTVGPRNDEECSRSSFFEPIWSFIVLPLFFTITVV
jgi:hypothetical protein